MAAHPSEHAPEGLARLALLVDALLRVQIRVVHARRARDQDVHVARHRAHRAARGRRRLAVELADVAEEQRRREVPLDVGLLEGSISHEKACSTFADARLLDSALQMRSSASRGDSVPEHIVATRSGRPSSSCASFLSEHPSSAPPLSRAFSSATLTMSANMPLAGSIELFNLLIGPLDLMIAP